MADILCAGGISATITVPPSFPGGPSDTITVPAPAVWDVIVGPLTGFTALFEMSGATSNLNVNVFQTGVIPVPLRTWGLILGGFPTVAITVTLNTGATFTLPANTPISPPPGFSVDPGSGMITVGVANFMQITRSGPPGPGDTFTWQAYHAQPAYVGRVTDRDGAIHYVGYALATPAITYTFTCEYPVERPRLANKEILVESARAVGGYEFKNAIHRIAETQRENRINKNPIPMLMGRFANLLLRSAEMEYLIAFFSARRGKQQGFRVKNAFDYKLYPVPTGRLDYDPDTWTMGGVMEEPGLDVTYCYAAKIYSSHGLVTKKPVYFFRGDTAKLYQDGAYIQDITIDETGKFLFTGNTSGLSIEGEFDIPVWFDVDRLGAVLSARDERGAIVYRIEDLPFREKLTNETQIIGSGIAPPPPPPPPPPLLGTLILHFNRTGPSVLDCSANNFNVPIEGFAGGSLTTNSSIKYNGFSSGEFNVAVASGNTFRMPFGTIESEIFDVGAGDYSCEMFLNLISVAGTIAILKDSDAPYDGLHLSGGVMEWWKDGVGAVLTGTTTLPANEFIYLAFKRVSGVLSFYTWTTANGFVTEGSAAFTDLLDFRGWYFGKDPNNSWFRGYVDEFRFFAETPLPAFTALPSVPYYDAGCHGIGTGGPEPWGSGSDPGILIGSSGKTQLVIKTVTDLTQPTSSRVRPYFCYSLNTSRSNLLYNEREGAHEAGSPLNVNVAGIDPAWNATVIVREGEDHNIIGDFIVSAWTFDLTGAINRGDRYLDLFFESDPFTGVQSAGALAEFTPDYSSSISLAIGNKATTIGNPMISDYIQNLNLYPAGARQMGFITPQNTFFWRINFVANFGYYEHHTRSRFGMTIDLDFYRGNPVIMTPELPRFPFELPLPSSSPPQTLIDMVLWGNHVGTGGNINTGFGAPETVLYHTATSTYTPFQ